VFRVTRRYKFAASHRLHTPQLSEEENRRIYGKCNHPYGHGHNYTVEVSARGPVDDRTGCAVNTRDLDELVEREVLASFANRNLNLEVDRFAAAVVPTSENLGVEICRRLKQTWQQMFPGEWPKLEKIRIEETPRNIFEINADEIA
jgi:6-pyruvoyltetrahydropterin/6-carboxytetrahydropterin synthase